MRIIQTGAVLSGTFTWEGISGVGSLTGTAKKMTASVFANRIITKSGNKRKGKKR